MRRALAAAAHLVVFDVNVYLDVARLLGEPFDWSAFHAAAVAHANDPLPHPSEAAYDSVRAIASVQSGTFANGESLEVWTSDHIDDLVEFKASQSRSGARPEDRGLGWSPTGAADLVSDLVGELVVSRTGGASVGQIQIPYGSPPLSHEDGLVYRTVDAAGGPHRFSERYCVTRDKEFRRAQLPGLIHVVYPHEWVALIRAARRPAVPPGLRPN